MAPRSRPARQALPARPLSDFLDGGGGDSASVPLPESTRCARSAVPSPPSPSPSHTDAVAAAAPQPANVSPRQTAGPSLAARALRALALREHSCAELRRKLAPHADDPAQLEAVLATMQTKGFLSDERAAAALARQKSPRYGSARIRQDLRAKGLDRELIDATLAPLQENEWERAKAVWLARFGHADTRELDWPARRKLQAKQVRFMTGRGFAPETVRRLLDGRWQDDLL